MLPRRLQLGSKRVDGLRMRNTRGLSQTIPGERRVSASGCVLKLPEHLPSKLPARPSVLRFSAAARLELNVQNAGS